MKKIMQILISSAVSTILIGIFSYLVICIIFSILHILFKIPMIGFDYAFYISFFTVVLLEAQSVYLGIIGDFIQKTKLV